MSILGKPKFQNLQHGECAGAPILKSIWDKFDFSFLLAQAGIHRNNGTPTWMLCFLYVIGLVCRCSSVLQNGLEYPLFYRVWLKPKNEEEKKTNPTKFDLAMKMLPDLRQLVKCRLWIAMDRWYLCKEFFNFLEDINFDWVTKATALYRKEIENCTGRIRYVPVNPITLIKEVFLQLKAIPVNVVAGISIPNIYMKRPYKIINKKGKEVTKQRYVQIAAVAAMRLKEDDKQNDNSLESEGNKVEETPATYRGAYIIISNRFDHPQEALNIYIKRWRIIPISGLFPNLFRNYLYLYLQVCLK